MTTSGSPRKALLNLLMVPPIFIATPTFSNARRRRFIALLAAFGLIVGQVLLSQHVHAEELPEQSCVVCLQDNHTPVLVAPVGLVVESVADFWLIDAALEPATIKPIRLFLARAPPRS